MSAQGCRPWPPRGRAPGRCSPPSASPMTARAGAGSARRPKAGTSSTAGVARAHARPSAPRSMPAASNARPRTRRSTARREGTPRWSRGGRWCILRRPMPFDLSLAGKPGPRATFVTTWRDAVLYALGIGAKRDELDYLYEGRGPRVLPELRGRPRVPPMLELLSRAGGDLSMVVHGGQRVRVHAPLAPSGTLHDDREHPRHLRHAQVRPGRCVDTRHRGRERRARRRDDVVDHLPRRGRLRRLAAAQGGRARRAPPKTRPRLPRSRRRPARSRPSSTASRATPTRSTPTPSSREGSASSRGPSCMASARSASWSATPRRARAAATPRGSRSFEAPVPQARVARRHSRHRGVDGARRARSRCRCRVKERDEAVIGGAWATTSG